MQIVQHPLKIKLKKRVNPGKQNTQPQSFVDSQLQQQNPVKTQIQQQQPYQLNTKPNKTQPPLSTHPKTNLQTSKESIPRTSTPPPSPQQQEEKTTLREQKEIPRSNTSPGHVMVQQDTIKNKDNSNNPPQQKKTTPRDSQKEIPRTHSTQGMMEQEPEMNIKKVQEEIPEGYVPLNNQLTSDLISNLYNQVNILSTSLTQVHSYINNMEQNNFQLYQASQQLLKQSQLQSEQLNKLTYAIQLLKSDNMGGMNYMTQQQGMGLGWQTNYNNMDIHNQ
jgi:hypothetical protein